MTDESKPVATATPDVMAGFQLASVDPTPENLPAVAGAQSTIPARTGGAGLTYQNAHADETVEMDKIIAGIDLLDEESKSIIALGADERKDLGDLSDQLLDSIDPQVKIGFAKAMKDLMNFVTQNSLSDIKSRIADKGIHALTGFFRKADPAADMEKMIGKFMTDISGSRKTIREMADKLGLQQIELNKNFQRINDLGGAMQKAEKRMQLVSAATTEFIRRIDSGDNKILQELEAKAKAPDARSDDQQTYQMAQTNWNALRTADAGLVRSIGVYDLNIGNLAFTKQANVQNRIQTAMAIASTINEWKAQLAVFGTGSIEKLSALLLQNVGKMNDKSVQATQDMFESMLDVVIGNSAAGAVSLRQVVQAQEKTAEKLKGLGDEVNAKFDELAQAKAALVESSAHFRQTVATVYSQGHLGVSASAPRSTGPT
jgi:hypothetical protein